MRPGGREGCLSVSERKVEVREPKSGCSTPLITTWTPIRPTSAYAFPMTSWVKLQVCAQGECLRGGVRRRVKAATNPLSRYGLPKSILKLINSHPNGRHQPLQVALLPKSHSPEELLSSRHRLALVFRQHRAAGVEKSPPQLLIIRGGHRQHPTPTPPAFVLSSYKLSGKLFEDGGRSRAALINSPSALVKLLKTRGGILMSSAESDVLRAGFREKKTISLWLKNKKQNRCI